MAKHGAGSAMHVMYPSRGTHSVKYWGANQPKGGGSAGTAMHMKKRSGGSDRPGGAAGVNKFVSIKKYGLNPEEKKKVDRSKQPASMAGKAHVPVNKGAPRGPKYHGHLDKGPGYI